MPGQRMKSTVSRVRSLLDLAGHNVFDPSGAGGDARAPSSALRPRMSPEIGTQYAIHELARLFGGVLLRHLDRLVHRDAGRDVRAVADLVEGEAEDVAADGGDPFQLPPRGQAAADPTPPRLLPRDPADHVAHVPPVRV